MNAGRKKLLIVDDEEPLTEMMRISLEALGNFRVRTENDPLRAVEVARRFQPDLIVLDLYMPELDGEGVIARIRNEPELAKIPVVFFSGYVSPSECTMIGNCRLLSKMMTFDEVAASLKQALADADGQSTPLAQPLVA